MSGWWAGAAQPLKMLRVSRTAGMPDWPFTKGRKKLLSQPDFSKELSTRFFEPRVKTGC